MFSSELKVKWKNLSYSKSKNIVMFFKKITSTSRHKATSLSRSNVAAT